MKRLLLLMMVASVLVIPVGAAGAGGSCSYQGQEFDVVYQGTRGDDVFPNGTGAGLDLAQLYCGGAGNDQVPSLGPGDVFIGGSGDDFISAGMFGDSVFEGGRGNDFVSGMFGDAVFNGGANDDFVRIMGDIAVFVGGNGDDQVGDAGIGDGMGQVSSFFGGNGCDTAFIDEFGGFAGVIDLGREKGCP